MITTRKGKRNDGDTADHDRIHLRDGETDVTGDRFSPSVVLFWLKTSVAASNMRVMYKSPNTLLGVIPLGSNTQTIPLRNIASVDTNTKFNLGSFVWGAVFLIAGLACLSDSAALGILFLLLAAANLANTMSAQLDFVNQAGGRNTVKVSILKKAKLMQLAQAIQQLVFADVEGQRHQESMDMTQKQYAAQTNSVLIQQQMLDQQRKANAGDNPPTPTE
ncbi:MAG: hypothetical protein ACLRL3_06225 [Bifidobacterium adolescentis]